MPGWNWRGTISAPAFRKLRSSLRAEAAVGRAAIKMLLPIVVFILPALFVITLVPGMLGVLQNLDLLGGGGAR
jgi:pilus assembly protein TadC